MLTPIPLRNSNEPHSSLLASATMTHTISFDEFVEAFIAALVDRGVISLDPNAESTNLGIGRIFEFLSTHVAKVQDPQEQLWFTRLRNSLAPSNIGTYDYFLAALRSCQLGFASSPNPRYSEISFRVSKPQAERFLAKQETLLRNTAICAANAFLGRQIEVATEINLGRVGNHVGRTTEELAA